MQTNWIGLLLISLVGYQLYRGRISISNEVGQSSSIRRSARPAYFWLVVAVELLLASAFIFGMFRS